MSRVVVWPYARRALGTEGLEVLRTRIPVGYWMSLSAEQPKGPYHVTLWRKGDEKPLYDRWHRDIEDGCGEALALLPTDLEAQLAASLRAVGA